MRIHVKWSGDQFIWPSIAHGDEEECMSRWMLEVGRLGAILLACGYTSNILQGANVLDLRPAFVSLDDLDNRESGTVDDSKDAEKIEKLIDHTISGMRGQGSKMGIAFLCTVSSRRSSAFTYTDPTKKPAYAGKRVKRVRSWPDRMDLWEKYMLMRQHGMQTKNTDGSTQDPDGRQAHAFYLENEEEMNRGAELNNYNVHDTTELPDGTQVEHSSLQNVFNFIADNSREAFNTEYQQDPPPDTLFESSLEPHHIRECEGDFERLVVDPTTSMIVRAIDVRKIELHWSALASDDDVRNRVIDYDVKSHGTSETTVEQAEELIYNALNDLADEWEADGYLDWNGGGHSCGVTLIDKGWMGSWNTEDGEEKTWITQPVETFCDERGLRNWLPAKGQPSYRSPAESPTCIVGDHWHMNGGAGVDRNCTEVIWDVAHWRALVEELFMIGTDANEPSTSDDPLAQEIEKEKLKDKFVLFLSSPGVWVHHKRLGEHIQAGAKELAESRRTNARTRKRRYRRDHWWDSFAMMLVARSVEEWFRENIPTPKKRNRKRPKRPQHSPRQEIGAR